MSKKNKLFIRLFASLAICLLALGANTFAITATEIDPNQQNQGLVEKIVKDCDEAILQYGNRYNYIISDYDINIRVNENNTYDVIESYTVCFAKQGSHGIYRKIPKKISGWRSDGSTYKANAIISNLTVSGDKFEKENNSGYVYLKIGDPDKIVREEKAYTISYRYDFGEDTLEGADEFYFNLIGANWDSDTIFLDTSFEIAMPKSFEYDKDKLGFTEGPVNTSRVAKVTYDVTGRKIKGTSQEKHPGGSALTIRLVLPEGYFVGARKETYPLIQIAIVASAVMLLIAYIFFLKYGNDNKIHSNVQYDPPKELNPLEFGMLAGYIQDNAIMGLVFHLAEKGYLKIESDEKGKHFTIHKVKEYDGEDNSEKVLMQELFSYSKDNGKTVTDKDLQNKFYNSFFKIIKASNISNIRKECYDRKTVKISAVFLVLSILLAFAVFVLVIIQNSIISSGLSVLMSIVAVVGSWLTIAVSAVIRKKTPYGEDLFTRIKSYKDTLKSANILSDQGASYFYYNYAFAYAIGYNTVFSRKFKDVVTKAPSWYTGSNFTNLDSFASMTNSIGSGSMSSPGGSGSGGGMSGGGGGGGGGGGW
jgi:uncharacterized membrane protein